MGNCVSIAVCDALDRREEPLEANPDVVGPGVLASFLASAVLTLVIIVYGYFTRSLPDQQLNLLDEDVISQLSHAIERRPLIYLRRLCRWTWAPVKWLLQKLRLVDHSLVEMPHQARVEAVTRFVLILSDQQLVTGLGILIAAFAQRCTISVFEFRVVTSLAWFSTVVHLATLSVLRTYFSDHPEVLFLRAFAMFSTLALLIAGLTISISTYQKAPVQCAINYLAIPSDANRKNVAANNIIAIFYLFAIFISRLSVVLRSVFRDHNKDYRDKELKAPLELELSRSTSTDDSEAAYRRALSRRMRPPTSATLILRLWFKIFHRRKLSSLEFRAVLKQALALKLEPKSRKIDEMLTTGKLKAKATWWYLADSVDHSFSSQFPFLVFGMSYGICQTVMARSGSVYNANIRLTASGQRMDFGQLLPIFLLLMPILTAAEIYYEAQRKLITVPGRGTHAALDLRNPEGEMYHTPTDSRSRSHSHSHAHTQSHTQADRSSSDTDDKISKGQSPTSPPPSTKSIRRTTSQEFADIRKENVQWFFKTRTIRYLYWGSMAYSIIASALAGWALNYESFATTTVAGTYLGTEFWPRLGAVIYFLVAVRPTMYKILDARDLPEEERIAKALAKNDEEGEKKRRHFMTC